MPGEGSFDFGSFGKDTKVPPVAAVVIPPVIQKVEKAPEVAKAVESVDEEAGLVSFGQKIAGAWVVKFKGVKNFNKRIGILDTKSIFAMKTHYDEEIRSFRCFGTLCCEGSDPTVRYLAAIILYDTNAEGSVVSPKFDIQYIALSPTAYDSLAVTHKSTPLDTLDLVVICSDDQYQKNTFSVAGPAQWRVNEAFAKAVWEKYEATKKRIPRSFAKTLGKTTAEAEAVWRRIKQGVVSDGSGNAPTFDMSKFIAGGDQ